MLPAPEGHNASKQQITLSPARWPRPLPAQRSLRRPPRPGMTLPQSGRSTKASWSFAYSSSSSRQETSGIEPGQPAFDFVRQVHLLRDQWKEIGVVHDRYGVELQWAEQQGQGLRGGHQDIGGLER